MWTVVAPGTTTGLGETTGFGADVGLGETTGFGTDAGLVTGLGETTGFGTDAGLVTGLGETTGFGTDAGGVLVPPLAGAVWGTDTVKVTLLVAQVLAEQLGVFSFE